MTNYFSTAHRFTHIYVFFISILKDGCFHSKCGQLGEPGQFPLFYFPKCRSIPLKYEECSVAFTLIQNINRQRLLLKLLMFLECFWMFFLLFCFYVTYRWLSWCFTIAHAQTRPVVFNNPGCPFWSLLPSLIWNCWCKCFQIAMKTFTPKEQITTFRHSHNICSHIFWRAFYSQPCQVHHDSVSNGWRKISSSTSWVEKEFDYWRHIFNTLSCFWFFLNFCIFRFCFSDMQRNFAWHLFFLRHCVNVALYTQMVVEIKKNPTTTVRRHVWLSCNCLKGADKAWSQMCWAVFYPELFISLECHISVETWRLCSQLARTRTDEFCLSVAKRRGSCFSLLFGVFSLSVFSGFVLFCFFWQLWNLKHFWKEFYWFISLFC